MPHDRSSLSRRGLLGAGGLLAASAAGLRFPSPALAQSRTVKLTLPWLANGSTLFTYVAKNQGFFRKRGLDVSIARGFGSVAAAQAVAAGEFDFGLVFAGGVILGAARGLPLVVVGTLGYDATMGTLVRADSLLKTAKDLEGMKIGTVPTSAESPYWPAFAEKAGVSTAGVTMVQMDNRVLEQSVINKQVDAVTAIATSSVPVMMALNQPSRFMLWSKSGVALYAGQVVTRADTLSKDKELCRAVTEALVEGLVFTLKDPEAGIDIFLKEVPEIAVAKGGRENARISQGLMHYTVVAPESEQHAIGYTDMARAAGMVDLVMAYGAPKDAKRPDPGTLFSNAFVGDAGRLTPEQWATVKKNVGPYADVLG